MSASATGANVGGEGLKHREHKQGNQGRTFTPEQKAAVIRVRKCSHTAFYEILDIQKSATDGEIKKAYRKLSLLTHPDKNGYDGADEAFKMVSRAFQILSDSDKKSRFDQFGGDPDSRFGAGSSASASPFSGFARQPSGGGFQEEMTPEELFRQFFGGGMGGGPFGGGLFDQGGFGGGGPFVFNMGGGPGFRVHQFGGQRARRRPRDANGDIPAEDTSPTKLLTNLLPILILFLLPFLTSLFSESTSPRGPNVQWSPQPPYTEQRTSYKHKVPYYVNPKELVGYTEKSFRQLDRTSDVLYENYLQTECSAETVTKRRLYEEAQGWFFPDEAKLRRAREYPRRNCDKLKQMGYRLDDRY